MLSIVSEERISKTVLVVSHFSECGFEMNRISDKLMLQRPGKTLPRVSQQPGKKQVLYNILNARMYQTINCSSRFRGRGSSA